MKIQSVSANNRRRRFDVRTRKGDFGFPYPLADPAPSAQNRVVEVFADPELAREAFTYRLASGDEGTIHVDSVLEYNQDPDYMAELTNYKLSVEARRRLGNLSGDQPEHSSQLVDVEHVDWLRCCIGQVPTCDDQP